MSKLCPYCGSADLVQIGRFNYCRTHRCPNEADQEDYDQQLQWTDYWADAQYDESLLVESPAV